MSQDNTANTNLSLSPAITGWLDFHTKVICSDIDWMAEGASPPERVDHKPWACTIIGKNVPPEVPLVLRPASPKLSHTARHAHVIWHMRDSYLSKLNTSVPRRHEGVFRSSSGQQYVKTQTPIKG